MKKLIFAFTCLLFAIPCQAKIIYVDANGTADFNNIQAAINDSNDGDTIIVADGTYTGNGNRDIDYGGRAITVRSENGPNNCIIDCEGTSSDNHRGFYFHSGENANSVLDGLTVRNGYMRNSSGGAIYCREASPTVSNCTITNNLSYWGCGGGIYSLDSSIKISDCNIIGNSAPWGGGITCSGNGNPIISYCTIRGNTSTYPDPYILSRGGGICAQARGLKISYCTISGNSAPAWGGGIYCDENCTISHCTITGNSEEGIYCEESSPKVNCCTITGNSWYGIYCYDSGPIVTNCIFWDDRPSEISGFHSTQSVTYCNIEGGWPGIGNINAYPYFANASAGDYHLKSQAGRWEPDLSDWVIDNRTSPCIDSGNPGCTLGDEPNDVNNVRRNMGAYGGTAEASKSPSNWRSIADMTNDWVVDSNDLKVFVDYWLRTGECIPSDLNRSQSVDFNDYAIFGLQWSYPTALETGMTFHVDDCNMEAGLNWPETVESNEPRFKVWVEGRYIYFEDQMYANCCPDKLELEMAVEDNLVTIYETEYTSTGCRCVCFYPVTAMLGPFEPGVYTLEVYEYHDGFIGSTTVVIDPPP